MRLAKTFTDKNFEAQVLHADNVSVVAFNDSTQSDLQGDLSNLLETVATKYKGNDKVNIGEMSVDSDTAADYSVGPTPAYLFFVNGKELTDIRYEGAEQAEPGEIVEFIDHMLKMHK